MPLGNFRRCTFPWVLGAFTHLTVLPVERSLKGKKWYTCGSTVNPAKGRRTKRAKNRNSLRALRAFTTPQNPPNFRLQWKFCITTKLGTLKVVEVIHWVSLSTHSTTNGTSDLFRSRNTWSYDWSNMYSMHLVFV